MFDSNRIMLMNGVFFLVVVGLAYWIIQEDRLIPQRPDLEDVESIGKSEVGGGPDRANLPTLDSLARKTVFTTLIPIPPPTATPPPTPEPPPRIENVTQYWKIVGVLNNTAFFQDIKSGEDFIMKVGDPPKNVRYQNWSINIHLESAVLKEGKATVMMNEKGEVQRQVFDAFSQ